MVQPAEQEQPAEGKHFSGSFWGGNSFHGTCRPDSHLQANSCHRSELPEGDTDLEPVHASAHHVQWEVDDSGSEAGDIIHDAKFFQEVVTEYQLTYQSLDKQYTHQAVLVKEASEPSKPLKDMLPTSKER